MSDRNRKVSHKIYEVWNYDQEIEDLNNASKNGWQLVNGGCFRSIFEKSDERYVYQIDYNTSVKNDMERYTDMFAEQGWEYINSTFNGWHYFKKKYYEGMPVEEMDIYTDRDSLNEMQNRYKKVVNVASILYLAMAIMYFILGFTSNQFAIIGYAIVFVAFFIFMFIGSVNIKLKAAGQKPMPNVPVRILWPISVFVIILIIVLF